LLLTFSLIYTHTHVYPHLQTSARLHTCRTQLPAPPGCALPDVYTCVTFTGLDAMQLRPILLQLPDYGYTFHRFTHRPACRPTPPTGSITRSRTLLLGSITHYGSLCSRSFTFATAPRTTVICAWTLFGAAAGYADCHPMPYVPQFRTLHIPRTARYCLYHYTVHCCCVPWTLPTLRGWLVACIYHVAHLRTPLPQVGLFVGLRYRTALGFPHDLRTLPALRVTRCHTYSSRCRTAHTPVPFRWTDCHTHTLLFDCPGCWLYRC